LDHRTPIFVAADSRLLRSSVSAISSFFLPTAFSVFSAPSHPSATRVCFSGSALFSNRNEANHAILCKPVLEIAAGGAAM
jgi:hypothetical protein